MHRAQNRLRGEWRTTNGGRSVTFTLATCFGLAAAFCTTVAYVPQVVKAWRSKRTADISLGMFTLMVTGITLWLIYGLMMSDLPLILSNAVTLALVASILALKLRHG
jgi:MtN3 and saliva related transmembrane protein